ncbi:hypothetical protein QL285_064552 [Trifolium repens]|nr:hypothetical protein QL285_064552 [Trifolium repens]
MTVLFFSPATNIKGMTKGKKGKNDGVGSCRWWLVGVDSKNQKHVTCFQVSPDLLPSPTTLSVASHSHRRRSGGVRGGDNGSGYGFRWRSFGFDGGKILLLFPFGLVKLMLLLLLLFGVMNCMWKMKVWWR